LKIAVHTDILAWREKHDKGEQLIIEPNFYFCNFYLFSLGGDFSGHFAPYFSHVTPVRSAKHIFAPTSDGREHQTHLLLKERERRRSISEGKDVSHIMQIISSTQAASDRGFQARFVTLLEFIFIERDALIETLENAESYDGVIFTSQRAVSAFAQV
jgi:hypothetical protein